MRFNVKLQINNGDPCPKHEDRAWDWEEKEFDTLTKCIEWITEQQPAGFSITDTQHYGQNVDKDLNEEIIAEKIVSHFSR
jgi:hypothetical protein